MSRLKDEWEGMPGDYLRDANVARFISGQVSWDSLPDMAAQSYYLRRPNVMADRLVPRPVSG